MLLVACFLCLCKHRFAFGFCLSIFDVMAQNCLLEISPEPYRELVTGILESSWSLSVLTVVPLLGFIVSISWRQAFYLLAILTFLLCIFVFFVLKRIPARPQISLESQEGLKCGFRWYSGALAFNLSGFFFALAHNTVLSEFSILIAEYYNLSVEDAGFTQFVLGIAELIGAMLVMVTGHLPDIFLLSSLGFCVGILLYGMLGGMYLEGALFGLFCVYVPGENGIILRLSRASTYVAPADANSMLAVHSQFLFLGRALGAILAVPLYKLGHYECVFITFLLSLLALFFILVRGTFF